MKLFTPHPLAAAFAVFGVSLSALAQDFRHGEPATSQRPAASYVPDLPKLARPASSELRELVTSGKTKERDSHDYILERGPMPIEMVRAHATATQLRRDYRSAWKFIGENP